MHQYIGKTRSSVEKVHRTNEELEEANAELATRNDDLHERFDFATGPQRRHTTATHSSRSPTSLSSS